MDTSTGHLIDRNIIDDYELRRRGLDPAAYRPVPDSHDGAALAKLHGETEATVSLTSGGKLSKWAAGDRRAKRLAERTRMRTERAAKRAEKARKRQNRRPR